MTNAPQVICARVGSIFDREPFTSAKAPCSMCKADCWVAPSSVSFLREHAGAQVTCIECMEGPADVLTSTPEQDSEFLLVHG